MAIRLVFPRCLQLKPVIEELGGLLSHIFIFFKQLRPMFHKILNELVQSILRIRQIQRITAKSVQLTILSICFQQNSRTNVILFS